MDKVDEIQKPVDIIIPVYRNLAATRRCVESVLAHTAAKDATIILVDDASPEADLSAWCDQLAASATVELLRNDSNLGFVVSVNRGMGQHSDRDVVLLNSDTEVPPGWLERLRACALQADDIATVTPFSNNATICSYPVFCASSELPAGMDLAQLDQLFARGNAGQCLEIPTAVGFCMYIRRPCLDQLGLFDADRYGRGYGEENDFSRRAVAQGWRNLLCADLFVYHQGGVSFGDDRLALMATAAARVADRYPDYPAVIEAFVADDPPQKFRDAVDRLRLEVPGQAPLVVAEARTVQRQLQDNLDCTRKLLAAHVQRCAEYDQRCAEYDLRCAEYDQRCADYDDLLQSARASFAETDNALAEAQRVAESLQQQLTDKAATLEHNRSKLEQIKSSRFWRYTRWLRNLMDKQ